MTGAHRFPPDFRDFLLALRQRYVRYLLVGGWAVIHHGYPRVTADLDLWFAPTPENAVRVYGALQDFWRRAVPHLQGPSDLLTGMGVQFGVKPNWIDLLNQISGVDFASAWTGREEVDIDGMMVPFLGARDLLASKRAANRPKDQGDIQYLERRISGRGAP
ncbi:MAG: hypothetical protein HZA54_13945 [Planctomycetes bacterium]|nr:hypothetical protein [Planctomycetota bacterium]